MSTVEMRDEVSEWLENVDDNFMAAVHAMVGAYVKQQQPDPVIGYEANGTPITANDFLRQADEAMAAVDRGEHITLEELEKESELWLEPTR